MTLYPGTGVYPGSTVFPGSGAGPGTPVAIGFRAAASAGFNGDSWTIALPAGAVAGDVAVLAFSISGNGVPTTVPEGWTQVQSGEASSLNARTFYKVLAAGDLGTSVVFDWAGLTRKGTLLLAVYSGVDATTPIDVAAINAQASSGSTTSRVIPQGTVVTAGAVVLAIPCDKFSTASTPFSPPPGFTQRAFVGNTGAGADAQGIYEQAGTLAAGDTAGGQTFTSNNAAQSVNQLVVLRPGATPTPTPDPSGVALFDNGTEDAVVTPGAGVSSVDGSTRWSASAAIHGAFGITQNDGASYVTIARPAEWTGGSHTGSMYVRPRAVDSSAVRVMTIAQANNATVGVIRLHSSGTFHITDNSGSALATSTLTWSAGQVYRLDWQFDAVTNLLTVRIFGGTRSPEGFTPADTISATVNPAGRAVERFNISPALASAGTGERRVDVDTVRIVEGLAAWPEPYAAIVPGTVLHSWVGAPTPDGFTVRARVAQTSEVRLAVATSETMASAVVGEAALPDLDGYVTLTASGLAVGTVHYFQIQDAGEPIGEVGRAKTLPAAGQAASFRFALSACITTRAADPAALNDMVAWAPDFNVFTGDFHYQGGTSSPTTQAGQRAQYETQINETPGLATALRRIPWVYCTSDHEAGPDNGDSSGNAWTPANIAAYKQIVPHYPLADPAATTRGRWQTWVVGRVRFILLDVRNTDRTPGLTADGPAKTMLGADQKAWLKARLLDPEPVKVIVSDVAWLGPASTSNGEDKWWSYATERAEIASFVQQYHLNVVLMHGDSHALGVATPTKNTSGGFPVYGSAPLHNTGGGRNLGEFSSYWNNAGGDVRAYARITVTDSGDNITFAYSGWDAVAGVERVSQTDVFALAPGLVARITTAAPAGSVIAARWVEVAAEAAVVALAAPAGDVSTLPPTPYTAAGPVARAWAVAPEGAVLALRPFAQILAGPTARLTVAAWPGYVTPDGSRDVIVVDESGFDITVYSNTYATLGRIGDYISASVTWEWLSAGTGEIVVPADHWVVPHALTCNTTVVPVVIEVNGIRWTGRIASAQREHGADGTGTATLSLVDDWAWLQSVLAWPTPTAGIVSQTNAKSSATGKLATVSAALINDNMARLAAPVLALAPITDTSATVTIEARMELLSDYLVPLFQIQNWNLSATLWLPGDPQPVGYYAPRTGSLTSPPGTLSTPTVLITPTPNLSKPWVRWDDTVGGVITDSVGVVDPKGYKTVLAGSGSGTARIFAQYIDSVLGNTLGPYGFPEVFAEVSQGDTLTEVSAQGPAEASKNLGAASVAVTVQDGMPWRFGQDYFIGDMPRVELSGVALVDKPVTSVTASDQPDTGLVLVPTIGDNKAAATSDAMIVDVVQRIAAQVRRLQTGK